MALERDRVAAFVLKPIERAFPRTLGDGADGAAEGAACSGVVAEAMGPCLDAGLVSGPPLVGAGGRKRGSGGE
jgi:hypothetical protein